MPQKIVIRNGKLLIVANKLSANTVRYPGWTQVRICEVPLLESLFVPVIQEGFNCRVKAVVVFKNYDSASLLHESGSIVEQSVDTKRPQAHSYPSLNLLKTYKHVLVIRVVKSAYEPSGPPGRSLSRFL